MQTAEQTASIDNIASLPFTFHADAGHGWLEVPRSLLVHLGIDRDITGYSYMNGNSAYLEEDLDASRFFEAYKSHYGHAPEVLDAPHVNHSKIRNYQSFAPLTR